MKIFIVLILLNSFSAGWADAQTAATNATPTGPAQTAEKARAFELRDLLVAAARSGTPDDASWNAVTAKIDDYQKEFGVTTATTANILLLRKFELSVAKKFTNPARYNALLRQLAADPVPAAAQLAARQLAVQKRLADLATKPVELQFTALDGTSIDLSRMRGKVVLLDFWASWCPDCVTETPGLVEAYKKYHHQGFEIVGVSLDVKKEDVLAFANQYGMTWPQYFDGLKWNNKVSSSFDVTSIPSMWLFDRKGLLVTKNARQDLLSQVGSLLTTP